MGFFSKLFGRSRSMTKPSDLDFIRAHRAGPESLPDLLQGLVLWMESAPPVSDRGKLSEFMDYIAQDWHVSWEKGTPDQVRGWFKRCATTDLASPPVVGNRVYGLDDTPGFWKNYGVVGSVIEVGVSRFLHFIGKASEGEFFYLAHW